MAVLFYLWFILMALEPAVDAISYVGWAILMGFFSYATSIRYSIREEYNIYGNPVEDFFAVMIVYPFAAYQMEHHMNNAYQLEHPPVDYVENSHAYDLQKGKRGSANGLGSAYQAKHHLDHPSEMEKPVESDSWKSSISMQSLSPNGPQYNHAMEDDTASRPNSYNSNTEVI